MNVVLDSAHPVTIAPCIPGNGSKIAMQYRTHISTQNWPTLAGTEDHMNKNKCERLGHRRNYRSGPQPSKTIPQVTWGFTPCWYKAAPSALLALLALTPPLAPAQSQHVRIRIINAQTNKPVKDERLNIALHADQIGSVAMPTNPNGMITVDIGSASTIRILSNMYADCRPRGELYTDYSIATILKTGLTTGNLCSTAKPTAKPGELILFEIPKTYVRQYPEPPASNLPHSDENPQAAPH